MEGAVNMLLELLAEERMKSFALDNQLATEKRLRLQAENKIIELQSPEVGLHTSPAPQSFDTHSGLERLPRVRVKRADRVLRTIPLDETPDNTSSTGTVLRDCSS